MDKEGRHVAKQPVGKNPSAGVKHLLAGKC